MATQRRFERAYSLPQNPAQAAIGVPLHSLTLRLAEQADGPIWAARRRVWGTIASQVNPWPKQFASGVNHLLTMFRKIRPVGGQQGLAY
jgi:hypothetical protein